MRKRTRFSILRRLVHRLVVAGGAVVLTLAFFLILPLMQTISKGPSGLMVVRTVDTAEIEPPPPIQQEQPEEEPEPEEKPPELTEQAQPLSLAQLELALNPGGFGEGAFSGDLAVKLTGQAAAGGGFDEIVSMSELDQKPRVVYQPGPMLSTAVRRQAPGTVYIIFIVDERGRVVKPIVQRSSHPVFEKPALAAVRQWRFEPGKRNGEPVRFRMRVPMTFPKTQ